MNIFVDWGSTNFRAFLVEGDVIVDRRDLAGQGVFRLKLDNGSGFASFLGDSLRPWLTRYPDAPVLLCGAVGSREGWEDAGYVEAPAGLADLSARLFSLAGEGLLAGRRIAIVPGCAIRHENGRHDVMRSEETKALGAAAFLGIDDGLFCVPGTHCKWVRVEGGRIVSFYSVMTGELYGLLSETGSLARLLGRSKADEAATYRAFDEGLDLARSGQDLLADLWQVRSRALHDENAPDDPASYLSGILIGHELWQAESLYSAGPVVLLADEGERRQLYAWALEKYGWRVTDQVASDTAVIAGLSALL